MLVILTNIFPAIAMRPTIMLQYLITSIALLYCTLMYTSAHANSADEALNNLIATGQYDQAVKDIEHFPGSHLHELITQARSQTLWNEPTWKKLLHYKKNLWGGYTSQVDGADFFNSATGKNNPQAEMEATLARFFSAAAVAPTKLPPQCRFIARYQWLKQKLGFDVSRMPGDTCVPFEELRTALRPETITIIFPSAHPNSPSSMFGHTFARIDRQGQVRETRMLDFTINYAAQVDSQSTMAYAIKGLTGGFEGRFNVLPYHLKLREYAQMENRDLWEYRLNLTPQQVEMILQHAYELIPTYFDYYFFTENCAYHLLSLLEVALPDIDLTKEFTGWTIPVDTLKLLDQKYGMVASITFHPSHKAVIQSRRAALSAEENRLATQAYQQGTASIDTPLHMLLPERQAAVLDLAFDYLRYQKTGSATAIGSDLTAVERSMLLTRSQIKVRSDPPLIPQPATHPDQGHETSRFTLAAGTANTSSFAQLGWRAAYHDLLDPSPGYAWNSKLDFFNAELRYYEDTQALEVHKFTVIDIVSLEPRDDFFKHISWNATLGWKNRPIGEQRHGALVMEGGPGLTYELPLFQRTLAYGLLQVGGEYSNQYHNNGIATAGFLGGLLFKINTAWTAHAEINTHHSIGSYELDLREIALKQSVILSKDISLGIDASHIRSMGHEYLEASAGLYIYF